jgi:uncharacterized membrane protein YoaK (UPF0700 family)
MIEVAPSHEKPLPRWLPSLLSFVAGYVDSYTFLALFGLFVAQVTGSFVTAGAELVMHDVGIAGKMIAIIAFVVAAALTAGLIAGLRHRNRDALPWMLAFETVLIAIFCILMLAGPAVKNVTDWHGVLAGLFAAMAMGAQSVTVRLLMRGIPQTNVMTGNMTQVGIETMELMLVWRRRARNPADARLANEYDEVLRRLAVVLSIALGFIIGAACGAVAWAKIGLIGAPVAVLLVGALTVWAFGRDRD